MTKNNITDFHQCFRFLTKLITNTTLLIELRKTISITTFLLLIYFKIRISVLQYYYQMVKIEMFVYGEGIIHLKWDYKIICCFIEYVIM